MRTFSSRNQALALCVRYQSSAEAAASQPPAATDGVVRAAATSGTPAPPDTKIAVTQWSQYAPPAWRFVGIINRRETRKVARNASAPAAPKYVLGASADDIAKDGKVPTLTTPVKYLVHGDRLGPRPILVLDDIVPASLAEGSSIEAPLTKYAPLLSHLNHPHGAVSLPLVGPSGAETSEQLASMSTDDKIDFLSALCDDVITMLDALNVQFVGAVIARSTGALVAAKLASLYPERVGGVVVCDTPLVSKRWVDNHAARQELLKAAEDVNVPRSEIEFAVRSLLEKTEEGGFSATDGLESNVAVSPNTNEAEQSTPAIAAFNKAIYEQVIFDRALVYPTKVTVGPKGKASTVVSRNRASALKFLSGLASDEPDQASSAIQRPSASGAPISISEGLSRDNRAYLDPESLAAIRHPFMLVQPSIGATADATLHRNYFNLRKPTIISLGGDKPATSANDSNNKGKNKDGKKKQDEKATADAATTAATPKKQAEPTASSIFAESAAPAFAKQLSAFLNRFDLDYTLAKRYEQSAADLVNKMSQATPTGVAAAGEGGGNKKAKKEKGGKK